MLTKENLRYNLVALQAIAAVNILPIEINVKAGKISMQPSKRRRNLSFLFFLLNLVRLVCAGYQLTVYLVCTQDLVVHHFLIHYAYVIMSSLAVLSYFGAFLTSPEATIAIFNSVFETREEPPMKLPQLSRQDLTALALPALLFATMSGGAFIVDFFKMKTHIYHALPLSAQTPFLHASLFALEYIIGVFWVCCVIFALELQVLLFQKTTTSLEMERKSLQRAQELDLRRTYQRCRQTELTIQLANFKFAYLVFGLKISTLSIAVFNGCYTVLYHSKHPTFAFLYGLIGFDCVVIFAVIYEKAFRIPVLMQQVKTEMLQVALASSNVRGQDWKAFQKSVNAIQNVGVRVGSFHVLERESTPRFIHFLVNNLASMLLTFQQH